MNRYHIFNCRVAVIFGVPAAIILHHIWYWTLKNMENNVNHYDDAYWTYDSRRVLAERFPYYTPRQIGIILDTLIRKNILMSGNYNKVKYDRTLWYALTENGMSIVRQCYMDPPSEADGSAPSDEPIPDVSTDITADMNTDTTNAAILAYLNEKAGTTYTLVAETKRLIDARLADGFKPDEFAMVVDCMVGRWKDDTKMAQYLRPKTLFGGKMRKYLVEAKAAASSRLDDLDDIF